MVIDLSRLNNYIRYAKFKMEGVPTVRRLLQRGDFMATLDLKDAYNAVSISKNERHFFRFPTATSCTNFRLSPWASRTVPKLMRPVLAQLRLMGIRCVVYLDDWLIMAPSAEECRRHMDILMQLLTSLGLVLNIKKSALDPSQLVEYLGFLIDSLAMEFRPTPARLQKVRKLAKQAAQQTHLSAREAATLIGHMVSTTTAILPAKLCYHHLGVQLQQTMVDPHSSWNQTFRLNEDAREDLQWLHSHI